MSSRSSKITIGPTRLVTLLDLLVIQGHKILIREHFLFLRFGTNFVCKHFCLFWNIFRSRTFEAIEEEEEEEEQQQQQQQQQRRQRQRQQQQHKQLMLG